MRNLLPMSIVHPFETETQQILNNENHAAISISPGFVLDMVKQCLNFVYSRTVNVIYSY